MPPTLTEVHSANKAQLNEWLDMVYEEPADGWDSLNNDQRRQMVIEALEDPELVTLLDPQEPEDEPVSVPEAEEEAVEAEHDEDLSKPNPKTDLYSGVIRR